MNMKLDFKAFLKISHVIFPIIIEKMTYIKSSLKCILLLYNRICTSFLIARNVE